MKKIVFVILCFVVLCGNAFALPVDLISSDPVEYSDPFYSVSPVVSGDIGELTNVSLMSLNPVTPSDTSGLKAVLLDLLGDYDAVVVEYEYENNNGYTSYVREIQPDYVWLCSCGLLAIVVYCVFRLGGALLRD